MTEQRDPFRAFVTLVLSVFLAVMVGYLLLIGKDLLLPIFVAVISVYVLVTASDWLGTLPVVGKTPELFRRLLVMAAFILSFLALAGVIASTYEELMSHLPIYQTNLVKLADGMIVSLGMTQVPDWAAVSKDLYARVNLQALASWGLGSLSSLAGVVFMVLIYAMFLMGERGGFTRKIAVALPGDSAKQTSQIVANINSSIGDYLAVKTLVNVILAAISYAVMAIMGVDFALFWAILIGLLNYIPYVGSLLGVVFPVVLTMVQSGSVQATLIVAGLLTTAQMYVGNVLEPKMIGKKVNMSPFVVLVALGLWSSLWGVAGAILAIPLTSIIAIVFASFKPTRPLSILLADDVSGFIEDAEMAGQGEEESDKQEKDKKDSSNITAKAAKAKTAKTAKTAKPKTPKAKAAVAKTTKANATKGATGKKATAKKPKPKPKAT